MYSYIIMGIFTLLKWLFFINIPFGPKLSEKMEIRTHVKYTLPEEQQTIVNKVRGFYGLIGSNVANMSSIKSLMELFMEDGKIQGVFLDNGNITFVTHMVRTDKFIYEQQNGKIPVKNVFVQMMFYLLHRLKLLPNLIGMANTSILKVKNNYFALFERDVPYKLNIDFDKKMVETEGRVNLGPIQHFSAHSKVFTNDCLDQNRGQIETIEYLIDKKRVVYYQMTSDFDITYQKRFDMKYIPITHDFYSNQDRLVIIDSPLIYETKIDFIRHFPLLFDKTKDTIIYIFDKQRGGIQKYVATGKAFYVFHYGDYKETDDRIEIYASIYRDIDFMKYDIYGKYSKIVIDKVSGSVDIIEGDEADKYNLDFPMRYSHFSRTAKNVNRQSKLAFTNTDMQKKEITGIIIYDDLKLEKKMIYTDRTICGEPSIVYIDEIPYLLSFANTNQTSLFMILNLKTYETIEIPISDKVRTGFHSTFITDPRS